MVKVKICGITNLEDAQFAIKAGCDAIGFVFFKESRRYITPRKAKEIIDCLSTKVLKVGVFVDANEKDIRWILKNCGLNMLQFHGDESPDFCDRFKDCKVIKAFRIRRKRDVRNIYRYKVSGYLFDTYIKSKPGGTGEKFDWELVRDLDDLEGEIFISGGLTDKNVQKAIEVVNPDWVDVSSSVEKTPGKKDPLKVCNFIRVAKR